ncbi:hypothetical protein SH668x_003799 [Planctomicrobium sp. SH668]|uniref:hypothetical protein n=1 Tax=Planctomicrobium sp. SH668 TaxID=3448126 RepID=UPI003F5B27B3
MSVRRPHLIDIPESLRHQLMVFRRRLWSIKLVEAVAATLIIFFVGYLVTFCLDRFIDTPRTVRWGIWGIAALSMLLIPLAWQRWVYRQRKLEQIARLLSRKHPSIGDQLLGIIELAHNADEQERSPALVKAAIKQVSEEAATRDFTDSVPKPRHKQRSWGVVALGGIAALLMTVTASAAQNAWARYLAPWNNTSRFTYADVQQLPERIVVPIGEAFSLPVSLSSNTQWTPHSGAAHISGQETVKAEFSDGVYQFQMPPQLTASTLQLRVGDYIQDVTIEPMIRPELTQLGAEIVLPAYLERTAAMKKDIRGGSMSVVKGSSTTITATISRDLDSATVNKNASVPSGPQFSSTPLALASDNQLELDWKDNFGLSAFSPFKLTIAASEDAAPTIVTEKLPMQRVLLDSEVLPFQIRAHDDFGVKVVGIEWVGLDPNVETPAKGEKILGAGSSDAESLELAATFSAKQLGIAPQPIGVRLFVEDYLPGRSRVYSPQATYQVLDADQHAIWVTAQLTRWHQQALEVRDKELQLYETNKQLRSLSAEELTDPDVIKRIESQAAAERANGRKLSGLTSNGEEILKLAMRNPEIGVDHLERWAEMMQVLKDISGNRMPSVANLLKESAKPGQGTQNQSTPSPQAGNNLANVSGSGAPKKGEAPPTKQAPSLVDIESTMGTSPPEDPNKPKDPTESKGSSPRLGLPTTMLAGNGKAPPPNPDSPAAQKVNDAVKEQLDLLAEFDKIANELNELLSEMEGTTLVKRLKASARKQQQVAKKLGTMVPNSFGVSSKKQKPNLDTFKDLASIEEISSQTVSTIMDDMSAYYDRSKLTRFKAVLDDMKAQDVTAGLRNLGSDLKSENGLSIAQAEYWSENLDRWAENLVDASKCGACKGCKSKGSLPPSIVLEVLKIIEAETNLREQTRVAEQAKPAVSMEVHQQDADNLSKSQEELQIRIDDVVKRILELPDAEADFGKEIQLLNAVSQVMKEATGILATPETGAPAIAVETEVIELLLQSKRFNPNGGGGGGANPGGGSTGTTNDSALALVGSGMNEKEIREDLGTIQETGTSGPSLPEEFRSGLDQYFNQLEGQTK